MAKSKYDGQSCAEESDAQAGSRGGAAFKGTLTAGCQGKPTHTEQSSMFDGKASEIKGAPDANTTRVYKRIDNRTYEYVQSVGGKLTTTARTVVAADGKTRTITTTGKDAQGRTINNVAVYDRQ